MKDQEKIIAYLKDRLPEGAVIYFDEVKDKVVVEIGEQSVYDRRAKDKVPRKKPGAIDRVRQLGRGIWEVVDYARTNPSLAFLALVFVISVVAIAVEFLGF